MKKAILVPVCALFVVGQAAFAQNNPYPAINKLSLPTNAVIRGQLIAPASPAEPVAPLDSPEHDTNSWFQALLDDGSNTVPDTHGAVGPNHVMTILNSQVRIQNRAGTTNHFTSTLKDFWTNVAVPGSVFDPRAMYDPYEGRWISTSQNRSADKTTNHILIGTSMSSDPTGPWNKLRVMVQNTNVSDHPVLGFNRNWAVVTINIFTGTDASNYSQIYVFDKQILYASNAPTPTIFTNSVQGLGVCPVTSYDTNMTNMFLVQDYNGSTTNISDGSLKGYIRLLELRGPVASPELVTNLPFASTSQTWTNVGGHFYENFAPQLGTTQRVHTFDSRFASAVYRNGSIWCTHTVFVPAINPTRSAIQWWQIRTNGNVVQRALIGGENSTNFYAFPSIGVNQFNDVLIGYSRFSSNQYPSANYSFRAFYDVSSTTRKDRVLKAGESFYVLQRDGLNRWGDYSATVVDPNDVDLWTIQEYAGQHVNTGEDIGDGRWGTWWGKITLSLPANNAFSASQTISGAQGTTNGTTIRATREAGEPSHASNANTPSVWYTWTAPGSGHVTLELTPTFVQGSQAALAVYTGSAVGSLTLVTNDFGRDAVVTFNAASGTAYRIAVCGYNNSAGDFSLLWKQPTAPYFVEHPQTTNVVVGENATLSAVAIGSPAPSYQWRQEGTNLPGKTSANLALTNVQLWQGTNYTVLASNSSGIATSSVAALIIHGDSAARLSLWGMETNAFRLHISGVTNRSYIVQTSTNLNSATNWYTIHTNFVSFWYTNYPTTGDWQRFYRSITN